MGRVHGEDVLSFWKCCGVVMEAAHVQADTRFEFCKKEGVGA
jgi:hypothetical protein